MIITLPDEIRAAEDSQIVCYALNQTFQESYINLLKENSIASSETECSLVNKVVSLTNFGSVISNLQD